MILIVLSGSASGHSSAPCHNRGSEERKDGFIERPCYFQIIFACLVAVALADYGPPADSREFVPIIKDDRVHPDEHGVYSLDMETGDGIERTEQGGAGGSQGKVSFTFPDGQVFDLSFVADENGYQPQSSFLPVAPAFPHPIPQFVLDQIEFARQQEAAREKSPSRSYGTPN
ncbi:cuticle protein AM/CP1114-like [Oratosquilla oratoria]|uniref:cuticle protein AM/CP1114-like n=1 Tax=Oratosquilla oratoria TaxID=337810 RepID=UPI003F769A22